MPASPLLLALMAIVAGACLSVQAGVNSQLARFLAHPVSASAVSFVVGLIALLIGAASTGAAIPSRDVAASIPPYVWVAGGLLGATFMTINVVVTPRLGAAAMASLAIAGQLGMALLIDRYGLLGLATREVGPARLAGVVLLLVGAVLVTRF